MTIFDAYMLTSKNISGKNKFFKWLVAATIFLSVFSGYGGPNQSRQTTEPQTELFVTLNGTTNTKTVSYKKAQIAFFASAYFVLFDLQRVWYFNKLTNTQFTCFAKPDFITCYVYQHTIIPESLDEDDLSTHLG